MTTYSAVAPDLCCCCSQVLDSVTLANLDILINQSTGTLEGTLIERLDKCRTAGGKRLLREWVSAPLCDHRLIKVSLPTGLPMAAFSFLCADGVLLSTK